MIKQCPWEGILIYSIIWSGVLVCVLKFAYIVLFFYLVRKKIPLYDDNGKRRHVKIDLEPYAINITLSAIITSFIVNNALLFTNNFWAILSVICISYFISYGYLIFLDKINLMFGPIAEINF